MSVKKTTKSSSTTSKTSEKKVASKTVSKKEVKKDTEKKVVVKRRKTELKPTRASAVAIASQANRAKKKALIEKVSNSKIIETNKPEKSDTKIPLWVWAFFGCSLMLFCISFYQAIVRPQLETQVVETSFDENIHWSVNDEGNFVGEVSLSDINGETHTVSAETSTLETEISENSKDGEELIQNFFAYMSNGMFDKSFSLFDTRAQKDSNIKQYFGEYKMSPFFQGIEGKTIVPQNIQKKPESYKGKDVYTFDISYTLESTHEQYNETREYVAGEIDGEWKIFRIYCITSQCSRHPIFGPEKFGLMK